MTATTRAPEPAPQQPGVRHGGHRGPILIALMVTLALSAMDNTIVATALPQVVGDLGGFTLFSWVFSAYLLTRAYLALSRELENSPASPDSHPGRPAHPATH
jgi:hypothetical protein